MSSTEHPRPHRRQPRSQQLLWIAATAVALVGIALHFHRLGFQGYWSDELFTVRQTSGTLAHLRRVGRTEIHTPFFALLVFGWIRTVHSLSPGMTRILPALIGTLGAFESWWGLRRSTLPAPTRAVVWAFTACSGIALAHSQDLRPYALSWACCVGLTATVVRLVAPTGRRLRRDWVALASWGALASAAHLFGLLMMLCLLAVGVALRRLPLRPSLGCLVVGLLPQAVWIIHGLSVPGFAKGAQFPAPRPADVWHLVTTLFACGDVHLLAGGIEWRSPWLAALVALLLVLALALRLGHRHPTPHEAPEAEQALGLLALASLLMVVCVFVGSQVVHLWTTRNMIAVAPAATWAVLGGITVLPQTSRQRLLAAWACLALVAASLLPIAQELDTKYKTDFTGAARYIAEQRRQDPRIHLLGNPSAAWATGLVLQPALPQSEVDTLLTPEEKVTMTQLTTLEPLDGDTILAVYPGISGAVGSLDAVAVEHLGGASACHAVPVQGLVLVRCHRQAG